MWSWVLKTHVGSWRKAKGGSYIYDQRRQGRDGYGTTIYLSEVTTLPYLIKKPGGCWSSGDKEGNTTGMISRLPTHACNTRALMPW